MLVIRQGDVWLYPLTGSALRSSVFDSRKQGEDIVLAEGEVTGHAHRITDAHVELQRRGGIGSPTLIRVKGKKALLTHEEHSTLEIPPGTYEVRIQREYDPATATQSRLVYD